ncbi:Acetyltransferase (GNAT) family protein [Geoalkalibacter ferrihydriticus]|uniref:N-acetyltransferase domain-containing protein n=2 Tax=Geoalkalibacter ferrihydriticus TaxID=392333 RepID=A0A0C2EA60_9BACT|nr:GNAT family N-acetyltransferase [Geoalkalibacter ferrihydriticus]KIH75478.1 hypothetical protein GFER_16095 [Geoalkalibacter ferrihydriticus DSM 17813]SDM84291.1 Acetyltransferase (GNAT) family protein [Geoalkalibacter ferrihydriticus]
MKWFIKNHIFALDVMELMSMDLSQDLSALKIARPEFDVKVVRVIDRILEKKIEKTIDEMDLKKTFDLSEAKKRLANGYYFSYALSPEGEVVGWSWAAVNKVYFSEFNRNLKINSKEAFTYNAFVRSDYRGKKINRFLKNALISRLKKDGYSQFYGYIHTWNKSSIKSLESIGFKHVGRVFHGKLLFLDFVKTKRH